MKLYLLNIIQPDGPPPSMEVLGPVMQQIGVMNEELRAQGKWVFAGGLTGPEATTVVRVTEGKPLLTDGPFVEGKEHIGGFSVIKVADLDEALRWATRLAAITTLAIEVRPFMGEVP